jgi:hypothetical protein
MSAEVFITQRMHAATLDVVEQANVIIAEYLAQGFALSLRQLFYQMVSRALLDDSFKEWSPIPSALGRNGAVASRLLRSSSPRCWCPSHHLGDRASARPAGRKGLQASPF